VSHSTPSASTSASGTDTRRGQREIRPRDRDGVGGKSGACRRREEEGNGRSRPVIDTQMLVILMADVRRVEGVEGAGTKEGVDEWELVWCFRIASVCTSYIYCYLDLGVRRGSVIRVLRKRPGRLPGYTMAGLCRRRTRSDSWEGSRHTESSFC
jgi:hypothetical protein